jgi:glycosyltransferase involved in cell wall biosynthesis
LSSKNRIAVVLKGYPRLSETFIAQEILELERAGFEISIISLRHPTDKHTHPVHAEIKAPKHYLPEYIYQELFRVWWAKINCTLKSGFWKTLPIFMHDFIRDPSANRIRRWGQAMVLAHEYAGNHDHIYAHFLHTPCSVARYAALISGKSFSISAHAKDIWTSPEWEMREKLEDCDWLVTCTEGGADYLNSLAPDGRVHLVYHGLDLSRFPPPEKKPSNNDGKTKAKTVNLVTVGRAVSKKGIDSLLKALAKLPDDLHWHWTHIGGGPLKGELEALAISLGIAEQCDFKGALPQSEVLETYRNSDLFILPSRIDESGDRDGLPNVIVEAQSQAMAVISTNISGIPELIQSGTNGLLIQPDKIDDLASAIETLSRDVKLRNQMGKAGEERVRSEFSHKQTIGDIILLLNKSLKVER